MKVTIQTISTLAGGFLGWYLGGFDGFLYALIAFVIADYITGVFAAVSERQLSSSVGFKGIFRKVLIFIMVVLANLLDVYVLGEVGILRTATIFFYISNEGISLIENAARLGLPIPQKLRDTLAGITDKPQPPADGSGDVPGDIPPDQQGQTLFDLDDDIPPEEQEIKW